jgi:hypothetical protein
MGAIAYAAGMSLLCVFGRHRPGTSSMARSKDGDLRALCDNCGLPLERADGGRWKVSPPLAQGGRERA